MDKKQFNKLVSDIVKTAILAEFTNITQQEVMKKYNNVLEKYGEEKADQALRYTLEQFKPKAKEKEQIFWLLVKNETFNRYKSTPAAIRDLKSMIKSGEIDITGYTKEQEIRERLEMPV